MTESTTDKAKASKKQTLGGCLIIIIVVLLLIGACSALFGGDEEPDTEARSETPTSVSSQSSAPETSPSSTSSQSSAPETSTARTEEALSPEQSLRREILNKIGDLNREGPERVKVRAIGKVRTPIIVTFASNENLTEGLTKKSLQVDAVGILRVVQEKADWRYNQVIIVGTYPLVDQLGNTKERQVVRANYSRSLVEQINFENFLSDNVFAVADSAFVHPAFRD